jgi:hypothetical protein
MQPRVRARVVLTACSAHWEPKKEFLDTATCADDDLAMRKILRIHVPERFSFGSNQQQSGKEDAGGQTDGRPSCFALRWIERCATGRPTGFDGPSVPLRARFYRVLLNQLGYSDPGSHHQPDSPQWALF